jgi:hypothetical protein
MCGYLPGQGMMGNSTMWLMVASIAAHLMFLDACDFFTGKVGQQGVSFLQDLCELLFKLKHAPGALLFEGFVFLFNVVAALLHLHKGFYVWHRCRVTHLTVK